MWAELAPFVQPSFAVLLALVVVLLLAGKLVPLATLTREIEAERRRAEDLLAARDAAEARADKLADYLHQLQGHAQLTTALMTEMRRAVDSGPEDPS